ncbi:protein-tyrosine phosphatase-like protein [Coprinopsis sp. MPI-PUGE-AT-0042]|nr:protein-tyrosine phosphatase-like protein [Coprinopsis sp. MPI-PUGE-AT-0042]
MIPEFARLASHHQHSDYNRLRFGLHGSPHKYLPVSLHGPQVFHDLCSRRVHAAEDQTTWLLASHSRLLPPQRLLGPSGVDDLQLDLHDEISDAINEPLTLLTNSHSLVKTSLTHPINVTCLVPPPLLSILVSNADVTAGLYPTRLSIPPRLSIHNLVVAQSIALLSSGLSAYEIERFVNGHKSPVSLSLNPNACHSKMPILTTSISAEHVEKLHPSSLSLGNMFMSSCPGKKVRLHESARNGRSAVCRDLRTDLYRMKDLGVRCIICCLDNIELEILGAPWPKYVKAAQQAGLDVLRLPMPEGLAPISPAYLDSHLNQIMDQYTFKGTSVLVHCRGGVGRAGVVACCWLIKLGICGWVDDPSPVNPNEPHTTVEFVERVISYVRRRRSPKAIETYEQVQFLVEYVEFLRTASARV